MEGLPGAITACLPQTQHISRKKTGGLPSPSGPAFLHPERRGIFSMVAQMGRHPPLPEALSHDILIPLRQEQAARGGFIAPTQRSHSPSALCARSMGLRKQHPQITITPGTDDLRKTTCLLRFDWTQVCQALCCLTLPRDNGISHHLLPPSSPPMLIFF